MFEVLKQTAELDHAGVGPMTEGRIDYNQSAAAFRCAMLYQLTGDDAWAQKSRGWVEKRINDPKFTDLSQQGLTLYVNGRFLAFAYDLCHGAPSWDADFTRTVSKKIVDLANVIFEKGGAKQNTNPASNWQALRYSSAGLLYLATDDEWERTRLNQCHDRVARYLAENLGGGSGGRGWNIEGLGYTYFPMAGGVAPFAAAMVRVDPTKDLRKVSVASGYSLWTTYAALVKTSGGLLRPDFSDDNPGTSGEGSYGFAFFMSPPALHPGLKYWYNRTVGELGDKSYDRARFGVVASLLYYPDASVPEKDPMTIPEWRHGFVETGGNGMQTWRNRYRDADDLVAQFYVKLRGNKGHNGPDALSFRIVGMDTLWATGGGRYGKKVGGVDVFTRSMNTLYPSDPDGPVTTGEQSGRIIGAPSSHADGGGAIVAQIAQNNVGVANHRRWFAADYSEANGASGAYVVYDTSDNGAFWQFCTLETNTITTEGRTFTITNGRGDTLRGTVLHPAGGVTFKTGVRDRGSDAGAVKRNNYVHFSSADGTYLVVMTVAKAGRTHPAVSASGDWGKEPKGKVVVGRASFTIEPDKLVFDGR